jgi:hypothetical protein
MIRRTINAAALNVGCKNRQIRGDPKGGYGVKINAPSGVVT